MARFIVVPQWQGSSSSRAMQLVDGALAIAGDLPRASCTVVDVPVEAGESVGSGVRRFSSLTRVRGIVEEAVRSDPSPAIVVGGDCGVSLGAVSPIAGDDLAILWLDAHVDLQTPATSPSGAFHGMVLRAILGEGADGMTLPAGTIGPERVVLAGTREVDDDEQVFLDSSPIRRLGVDELRDPTAVADAVAATGAARVYIHVDLDVLDPSHMGALSHPVPFGVSPAEVVSAIRAVRERLPLAGASITEFSPTSPAAAVDDLGAILRIVGALA